MHWIGNIFLGIRWLSVNIVIEKQFQERGMLTMELWNIGIVHTLQMWNYSVDYYINLDFYCLIFWMGRFGESSNTFCINRVFVFICEWIKFQLWLLRQWEEPLNCVVSSLHSFDVIEIYLNLFKQIIDTFGILMNNFHRFFSSPFYLVHCRYQLFISSGYTWWNICTTQTTTKSYNVHASAAWRVGNSICSNTLSGCIH